MFVMLVVFAKKACGSTGIAQFFIDDGSRSNEQNIVFFRESTKAVLTDRISAAPLPYYSFKQRR